MEHPVHLHGHDFYILSRGNRGFNCSVVNLTNLPHRDTALLPGAGRPFFLAWKASWARYNQTCMNWTIYEGVYRKTPAQMVAYDQAGV